MDDFIVGTTELENIGSTCAQDDRTKDEICAEMGVDPAALRKEARDYADVALRPGTMAAAKALTGHDLGTKDLVAAGLAVGFELGYRARQVVEGVEG